MTDELPKEDSYKIDIPEENDQNHQSESIENNAELAPANSEAEKADAEQDSKLSEGAIKAINKQHFKYQEQRRKAEALEAQKAELERELNEHRAKQGEIVIPEIPSILDYDSDEDYRKAIIAREEAIEKRALQNAEKRLKQAEAERREQERKAEKQQKYNDLLAKYNASAVSSGIKIEELSEAEKIVRDYNLDAQVAEFVMSDKDAPFVIKYLADNPLILDELSGMSPISAAIKISNDIKTAALNKIKTRLTAAPPPPDIPDSRGVPESIPDLIAGGRFE